MAQADEVSPRKAYLTNREDWDTWFMLFQAMAKAKDVWEYIDPKGTKVLTEPRQPRKPNEPQTPTTTTQQSEGSTSGSSTAQPSTSDSSSAPPLTPAQLQEYQLDMQQYRLDMEIYRERKRAIQDLVAYLYATVDKTWLLQVESGTTLRAQVKLLQDALETDSQTKMWEARLQLDQAYNGLNRRTVEKWVQNLRQKIQAAKRANAYSDKDFSQRMTERTKLLNAIQPIHPDFYSGWRVSLTVRDHSSYKAHEDTPLETILDFFLRDWRSMQSQPKPPSYNKAAFAATFQGSTADESTSKSNKAKSCILHPKAHHKTDECFLIHPSKRPSGFTVTDSSQAYLDEALKDPAKKKIIDESRKRVQKESKQKEPKGKGKDTNTEEEDDNMSAYTIKAISCHTGDNGTYPLANSFLLDTGSTMHICNNLSRFTDYEPLDELEAIRAGDTILPILGYGTVTVNCDDGPKLKLRNAAYVPRHMTSLVSADRLEEKGLFYEGRIQAITRNPGQKLIGVTRMYRQRVIEYNPIENATNAVTRLATTDSNEPTAPATTSTASTTATITATPTTTVTVNASAAAAYRRRFNKYTTAQVWHRRLGHLGPVALRHAVERYAKHVLYGKAPKIWDCSDCALGKAHRIISVDPPSQPAVRPGGRIHIDQFEFTVGIGGARYMASAYDEYSHSIRHYSYADKTAFPMIIRDLPMDMLLQHGIQVAGLRTDNDTTITYNQPLKANLRGQGIEHTTSAPHAPQQNARSERSGGVIIAKATAMRIGARFPEALWPEVTAAAAYLHNRSPAESLGWKTPLDVLADRVESQDPPVHAVKPIRATYDHLVAYGCKAYFLTAETLQGIHRSQKLRNRSAVGYLCGYDAPNIWRIWVPGDGHGEVVRTRDVIFDETSFYNPEDPPAAGIPIPDSIDAGPQLAEWFSTTARAFIEDSLPQPDIPTTDPTSVNPVTGSSGPTSVNPVTGPAIPTAVNPVTGPTSPTAVNPATGSISTTADKPATTTGEAIINPVVTPHNSPPGTPLEPGPPDPAQADTQQSLTPDVVEHLPTPEPDLEPGPTALPTAQEATSLLPDPPATSSTRPQRTRIPSRRILENQAIEAELQQLRKGPKANSNDVAAHSFHCAASQRIHQQDLPPEPRSFKELRNHPFGEQFRKAAEVEWESVLSKGVVQPVPAHTAHGRTIPLTWVFKYKFDEQGFLSKFKARICARGDLQPVGESNTYAATLAARAFRLLMAIAAYFDLDAYQLDAVNAFLNSPIDEEVYVQYPDGFKIPGQSLRLKKALYGLRRSPFLWHKHFSQTLVSMGLKPILEEPCIYTNDWLVVFFYVDDIVLLARPKHRSRLQEFIRKLREKYEMHDLGELKWFLGIRVIRDRARRKLWLSQAAYCENLMNQTGSSTQRRPSIPMPTNRLAPHQGQASDESIREYATKVGKINYASTMTRPDVAFAASELSQFSSNPSDEHHHAVNQVMAYLAATHAMAIEYSGSIHDVLFAADAAFADNIATRHSSQAFLVKLFGGPIAWRANKQDTVTTSSTEAELLALTQAGKEAIAMGRLFHSLDLQLDQDLLIYCDNQQTIRLVTSEAPRLQTKLRHVDIHHAWIRERTQRGDLSVEWLPTAKMPADGLTKPLSRQKHEIFVQLLGLVDISQQLRNID